MHKHIVRSTLLPREELKQVSIQGIRHIFQCIYRTYEYVWTSTYDYVERRTHSKGRAADNAFVLRSH